MHTAKIKNGINKGKTRRESNTIGAILYIKDLNNIKEKKYTMIKKDKSSERTFIVSDLLRRRLMKGIAHNIRKKETKRIMVIAASRGML